MRINKYMVSPLLPKELEPLKEITQNFWWCWNQSAIALLRLIDPDNWDGREHNPICTLGETSQERLNMLVQDDAFMMQLEEVYKDFKTYMGQDTWYDNLDESKKIKDTKVAYFSFEYGLHESLPNYSGGLGILSGDHLKSASDLGIPLVAIGLLYRRGYFRQYLNVDGWQQEYGIINDFYNMALEDALDENGEPIIISVDLLDKKVYAKVWKASVGRITLYYLDTNLEDNSLEDREITAELYGGNLETRIKQEILLGIGGVRALEKLKIKPTIYHMNEGHSAFLSLERLHILMKEHGLDEQTAKNVIYSSSLFTTHTPVPAGNDVFSKELMRKYFSDYVLSIDMSMDKFLSLGRVHPEDENEDFCMTVLALNFSARNNGVSELHGHVSRKMWKDIWPNIPEDELPIYSVTNGIHIMSWTSYEIQRLFDRYLGPRWRIFASDEEVWERVTRIPDAELWRAHERRKERLIEFARTRLVEQTKQSGYSKVEIEHADQILSLDALTIGFARRFATYKRGDLIFRDLERLKKILNNPEKPVQIIFSGKAHPQDDGGKEIIRTITGIARRPEFRDRIVFLEDYDINVARYMVQGVDVWLNNPRRPLEASGTSGMKVPPNGGINFSILDGWWDEAYDGLNGWAIGNREEYTDLEYQDKVESNALYNILEQDIIPLFYDRGRDNIPRGWVSTMKWNMQTICPNFSTNRMVSEYTEKFYIDATKDMINMIDDNYKKAKELKAWKDHIYANWSSVSFQSVFSNIPEHEVSTGDFFNVEASVNLGKISHTSVRVELYFGKLNVEGEIIEPSLVEMRHSSDLGGGKHLFSGNINCFHSGQNGYVVRLYPYHDSMSYKFEMNLILWS